MSVDGLVDEPGKRAVVSVSLPAPSPALPGRQSQLYVLVTANSSGSLQRVFLDDVGRFLVDRSLALDGRVAVVEDSLLGLPAHEAGVNEVLQDLGVSTAEPFAHLGAKVFCHMASNVYSDLQKWEGD